MKLLLLSVAFMVLLACKVSAHQSLEGALKGKANTTEIGLSAKAAMMLEDKDVYVSDTLYNWTQINGSLKILYIGSKRSADALVIILKGNNVKIDIKSLVGKEMHVSGKVIIYKRRPTIIVTEVHQLGTRIQI